MVLVIQEDKHLSGCCGKFGVHDLPLRWIVRRGSEVVGVVPLPLFFVVSAVGDGQYGSIWYLPYNVVDSSCSLPQS